MTTAYTSLLGLALPVTGELSGTWGDVVNNYITSYVDASVAGSQTISGSQTAVTLSTTNGSALSQAASGSTGSAQYQIINCTGNPASLLTITAPATSKTYVVINSTSTSQSVKIVGAGPTTGVTIGSGEKALVAWNGSDFVKVTQAGGLTYVTKTSNYTTQNNEGVLADTSGGAFTVTLPSSPTTGYQVVVADSAGTWGTNNLTIGRNGSTIADSASDLVCDISGVSVQLVYDGTTWNVYAQVGGNGGTAAVTNASNTFTAAQTFRAANAIRSEAASTQDAIVIAGRAGGTNSYAATLTPATLSANRTVTIADGGGNYTLGYLNIPAVGTKTSSYQLATTDVGKYVQVGTGGSITIPDATFSEGDVVMVFNNTTGNITITCSITTAYIAGTDADKATVTLATRGIANIFFISGTVCVITGNVT